jgi:hypothetical protein
MGRRTASRQKRRYPVASSSGIVIEVSGLGPEMSAQKQDRHKATLRETAMGLAAAKSKGGKCHETS